MRVHGLLVCLLFFVASSYSFELDLSSVYKLWGGETETSNDNIEAGAIERFKRSVDETLQKAYGGLKEVHGLEQYDHGHHINKRELQHNLIRDSLGIQILQGITAIYSGDSPYIQTINSLDITFCDGKLIVAYQFENGVLKVVNVGIEQILSKSVPLGYISLVCNHDSLLIVVASQGGQHSWAAKLCLSCSDPPYYQGLAPYNVLAVHQFFSQHSVPRFAFCSGDLVTIMTWNREYFQAPLVIPTHNCINVQLVSIHAIEYVIIAESGNLEIYKLKPMAYEHVQTVVITNATEIQSFSIGQGISKSFYLIVVNKDDYNPQKTKPVILKWHGDTYLIQQCLNVVEVTGISTVSVDNKLIIVVNSAAQGTVFFQFNGFKFVETFQYSASVLALPISVSFAYSTNGTVYLAAADANSVAIYQTDFFTKNEIADWHETALEACEKLKDRVTAADLSELIRKVKDSFFVNQTEPIKINGSLTIGTLTVTDVLTTEEMTATAENQTLSHNILKKLKQLYDKLNESKRKLESVKELLERALKTSGDQVVTASYHFENATFECQDCYVNSINVDVLNGHTVTDIENQVIYTDRNESCETLTFEHELTIDHLRINGLLNGFNTSHFLYNNSEAVITGRKTFEKTVSIYDLTVEGLVDNLEISPDKLLLIHGDQNVTGYLDFAVNITVDSLQVGICDGVDVDDFYERTVTVDGNHNFTGNPIFSSLTLQKDLYIDIGNHINNVDIFNLYYNAFRIDRDHVINVPYTFVNVEFLNGIEGNLQINGIRFPDDVVRVDEDVIIYHETTFEESISIHSLTVNTSINGIGLVEDEHFDKQLDIMVKHIKQTVTGHKTYEGDIHLRNDSIVTGKVDGVKLSELAIEVIRKNNTQVIPGHFIINGSVTFKKDVHVGGFINEVNLTRIFKHGVLLNRTTLPNFAKLTFENDIQVESLHCEDINGINTKKDLLFKYKNVTQIITGAKTFTGDIYIKSNTVVKGLINKVNLTFFEDVLYLHGNQNVTGKKTFKGGVHFKDIIVHGTVDTKRVPEDLIPINSTKEITVITKLSFFTLIVNKLTLIFGIVYGRVDGVILELLVNDSLTYEGDQYVNGTKNLKGGLTITEDSNLKIGGLINGRNFTEIYEDAVLLNKDQVIRGNKTFHNDVTFYKLNFTGLFDHVSDWELRENWLRQSVDQTIKANVSFETDVMFKHDIYVDGTLNGINLTDLYINSVKLDETTTINGPVLLGNTTSFSNVTLTQLVNGLKFSEDVVQVHKDYTIAGHKTFHEVVIKENLNSTIVDDVDIDDLCTNALLKTGEQNITGTLTVKGNIIAEDDIIVTKRVNNVNITDLVENVIKIGEDNVIGDVLNVTNLTINAPIHISGKINGEDFNELCEKYLSLTKNQTITANYTFEEKTEIKIIKTDRIVTTDGEVSGVNVKDLDENTLKKTGDQNITGNYRFRRTVFVTNHTFVYGTINKMKIPEDYVLKGRNNTITGRKTFRNLTIIKNLDISENLTVQKVDVSEWAHKAVYKSRGSKGADYTTITGTKIITNDVSLGNITADKLNNKIINKHTVLLTIENQTINAVKTIHNNLILGNITVEHVNEVDINDVNERTVKTNQFNNITGIYTFAEVTTFTNIETKALVDTVNVKRFFEFLNNPVDLVALSNKLNETGSAITDLKKAVRLQAVLLNYYYELYKVPGAIVFFTLNHITYVITVQQDDADGCHIVYNVDNPSDTKKLSAIASSDDIEINGHDYAAIAIQVPQNSNCPGFGLSPSTVRDGTGDQIQIYTADNDILVYYAAITTPFSIYQIKLFNLNGDLCVAAVGGSRLNICCVLDSIIEIFTHTADGDIATLAVTANNNKVYVALSIKKESSYSTEIIFYDYSNDETELFTECLFPTSALHFQEFRNTIYLVVAKKTTHAGLGAIIVFKIRDGGLEKFQVVYKVEGYFIDPVDVTSVLIEQQEMYFVILSDRIRDNVMLFKYEGAQGFTLHSTVTAKRGQKLNVMGRLLGVTAYGDDSQNSILFENEIRGFRPYIN